tara:strand:- start:212 stop:1069 length:858 start_codon:yes stop_codon:yes gene_type:complete
MTGYGKAEINLQKSNLTIELKSLNSKHIDINIKMSHIYRDKDIALRSFISEKLQRGKIELSVWKKNLEVSQNYFLNNELIKDYFNQIKKITGELNVNTNDIISSLLRMPDVVQKEDEIADSNEWCEIRKGIDLAIKDLLKFRKDEGKKLENDIKFRIQTLSDLLNKITPFVKLRIEKVKKNLSEKILETGIKNIDESRFEQELIYYLEKQDITEEQVRLDAHLNYFTETMKLSSPNGKKLGFITQEIGREINTIGSKSSNVDMQKIVVQMKDELEKIKEQLLNIL